MNCEFRLRDGVFVGALTYLLVALFLQIKSMSALGFLQGAVLFKLAKKGEGIEKSGHGQINLRVFVTESEMSPAQWRLGKAGS